MSSAKFPALALSLFLFVVGCGERQTAAEHVAEAQVLLAREEFPAAIIALKNALQSEPDNSLARQLLGEASFAVGDMGSAEKEFRRALALSGTPEDIYPEYAQALLVTRNFADLDELRAEFVEEEGRTTVLAAQALSLLEQSETEAAYAAMDELLTQSGLTPYAYVAAARVALSRGDSDESVDSLLEQALAVKENYPPAWRMKGSIASRQGKAELAEQAFSRAIPMSLNPFNDLYNRALLRIGLGRLDDAAEDLRELRKIDAPHPGVQYLDAVIALDRKDYARALESFTKSAAAVGKYPESLYYLAALHFREGNGVLALGYADQYRSMAPRSVRARKLSATIESELGNHSRVIELLEPVVANFSDDVDSLDLLARSLVATGDTEQGVEMLRRIAEIEPENTAALTRLGAGLMATGQVDEGLDSLWAAQRMNPGDAVVEEALVGALLRQGQKDAALEEVQAFSELMPGAVDPLKLEGRIHLVSGELEQARGKYEEARQADPSDFESSLVLAELAATRRDLPAARAHYGFVLDQDPDNLQASMGLAAIEALENNEDAMIDILTRTVEAHPVAVQPRVVLSRYYLGQGRYDLSVSLLEDLGATGANQPDVLLVLAEAEFNRERFTAAENSLRQLVSQRPDDARAQYLLASTQLKLNKVPEAIASYEKAASLNPDFLPSRITLARLYQRTGAAESFESAVVSLAEDAPGNADVMQLQAGLAIQNGDSELALAKLQESFDTTPTRGVLIELAIARRADGDGAGAIESLKAWTEVNPDDLFAKQVYGDFLLAAGQEDSALSVYSEIVSQEADNVAALNNLAWMLRDRDPQKALDYIDRAIAVTSDPSVNLLDTKAQVHLANGNLRQARRAIDEALGIAPQNPDLRFTSAQVYVGQGEGESAVRELESLLASNPDFSKKDEVEALLVTIR
ncbi:MAG: XrtA/PEP-CTERM system TPR-repeat protein PrsT [Pseudomonadota bacterium]